MHVHSSSSKGQWTHSYQTRIASVVVVVAISLLPIIADLL